MPEQGLQEQFVDLRKVGVGGINTFDNPQDIKENELADARNVVFDSGEVGPRKGSEFVIAKPTGETLVPLQLITARDSGSVDYMISLFGNHFYLLDDRNTLWIRINPNYEPAEITIRHGNKSWNGGISFDVLYGGNGIDNSWKWPMALDYVAVDTLAGSLTLPLEDAMNFPTGGGDIIIRGGGTEFSATYTSITGNDLNLSAGLAFAVTAGTSVTIELIDTTDVPKGKIFETYDRRLIVSNRQTAEVEINYSKQKDPEDFTPGGGIVSGGVEELQDAEGPITSVKDFGSFLLIGKKNTWNQFYFTLNADIDEKIVNIIPIVSGFSIGSNNNFATVKASNRLYYPTETEGIFELTPSATGTQISVGFKVLSQRINNIVTDKVFFTRSDSVYFDQKILWSVSESEDGQNSLDLVYDILRDDWSIFDGFNSLGYSAYKNELYAMRDTDYALYKLFQDFQDGDSSYITFAFTKRFDFGLESIPKGLDRIYLQGTIDLDTTLFVDVIFNEAGSLGVQTYKLSGNANYVSQPIINALGMNILGTSPLGAINPEGFFDVGFFRVYLDVSNHFGWYNIQLKFYSEDIGSRWTINGVGFNPIRELSYPPELVISPGI